MNIAAIYDKYDLWGGVMKNKTKLQKQRDKRMKKAIKVSGGIGYKNGKITKNWITEAR